MPPSLRVAQVLLVLPPLLAACLSALGDRPLSTVPIPAAVLLVTATLAVGLSRRREPARVAAVAVGWLWVALGALATVAGMWLLTSYGAGTLILLFVAGPLVLCGFGLAAATGSATAKGWCRP